MVLLSVACGKTSSLADSQDELEENSTLIGNTLTVASQNDMTLEAAIAVESPVPNPQDDLETEVAVAADFISPEPIPSSETLGEDCVLTIDEYSTSPLVPSPGGAPAAPNQTLLTGIVRCEWQVQASSLNIAPEMPIFITEVEIVEARDIEGSINRLTGQEGGKIRLFSKKPILADTSGRRIEALVTFRGDEHGGMYWIVND